LAESGVRFDFCSSDDFVDEDFGFSDETFLSGFARSSGFESLKTVEGFEIFVVGV
jgi:hypothetical protein